MREVARVRRIVNKDKRQLLLSLKYCTIESCFSVPMLTLTLGNMPFLIGFAVKALGWSDTAVGLLAAAPFFCLFIQPPITLFLQRRWSLHDIMFVAFLVNALPWMLTLSFPWLGAEKHLIFAVVVLISNFGNAVAAVAWSASISELVPLNIRGRYFGTRNVMFGTWSLLAVLFAGKLAERFHDALWIFGIIFTMAACSRLIGLFFLTRMKFPRKVMEVQSQSAPLDTFTSVFRDKNFVRLLLFTGLFGFFFNAGQPFYSVFVLQELHFSLGQLATMTTVQTLGLLVALRTWGLLVDRFGNKPVMLTSALIWLTFAAGCWLFAGPLRHVHLYATYFITGFMIAGFQNVGQFNLMIKMVPAENRAHYLSVYFSFTNLLVALGPITGGFILRTLPEKLGSIGGLPITRYHAVIVGSIILCLLTLAILGAVREPAARSMRDLVNVMWHMREFNPMLAATSLAEYVFTPRGLGKLARSSLRTWRRHTNVIEDVGEELIEGGKRVLLPKDKAD
jgi:MFS family permease